MFRMILRLLRGRSSKRQHGRNEDTSFSNIAQFPQRKLDEASKVAVAPVESAKSTLVRIAPRKKQEPPQPDRTPVTDTLKGTCYVIDGDTIVISGAKIRIAGIDAPELHHPWGKKSKFAMISLCKGQVITARIQEDVSYDRIVAKCYLPDGTDLAAELVKQGLALDWPKFSGGAYRHLEPEGVRKKLWRAAAKHQGKLKRTEM